MLHVAPHVAQHARRLAPATALLLAAAACADPTTGPTAPRPSAAPEAARTAAAAPAAEPIPGQYIVVFREEVGDGDVEDKVRNKVGKARGRLKHSYKAALKGFAAELSDEAVAELRADPDVAFVEQDQVVRVTATQSGATWGIDRIDQRNRPLSGTYTYTATASGVYSYIIDTGIQTNHSQFGTRASAGYDAIGDGRNGQDCNGHGTHVAGTVGGSTYGVAKGTRLVAVRVLNCQGSGTNSGVIAGIDWVRQNHRKPAVANMSLGGGASTAVDNAVNNLASAGVFVAVAAGNENQNACNVSPARAANVTTVAASTSGDAKASYSNYGSCVELYAPGSSITSAWINSTTRSISGTSMASPHVAGVAALYKATYGDASYSTIRNWLTSNATAGVITGNVTGTPNRLLYKAGL